MDSEERSIVRSLTLFYKRLFPGLELITSRRLTLEIMNKNDSTVLQFSYIMQIDLQTGMP